MKLTLIHRVIATSLACSLAGGGIAVTAAALRAPQAAPAAANAATPTATELLRRFGETQAKLQSFVIRARDGVVPDASRTPNVELRVEPKSGRFTSRGTLDDGAYNSQLWDGKEFWSYTAGPDRPGSVTLDRTGALNKQSGYLRQLRTGFGGAASMGYFRFDEERVDRLLGDARSLAVRPKTETVGGSPCYVVEGVAASGRYTLWLDRSMATTWRGGDDERAPRHRDGASDAGRLGGSSHAG